MRILTDGNIFVGEIPGKILSRYGTEAVNDNVNDILNNSAYGFLGKNSVPTLFSLERQVFCLIYDYLLLHLNNEINKSKLSTFIHDIVSDNIIFSNDFFLALDKLKIYLINSSVPPGFFDEDILKNKKKIISLNVGNVKVIISSISGKYQLGLNVPKTDNNN